MTRGPHEDFSRDYHVAAASDRRFGFVIGALLALFGAIRAYFHGEIGPLSGALCVIGVVLFATAALKPDLLAPLNRAWGMLGARLHKITNPVVLGVMYALAIVPTGLAMRLFGADPMGRRGDAASYWKPRTTTASSAQSLQKPF
jgi:hypothetical protein